MAFATPDLPLGKYFWGQQDIYNFLNFVFLTKYKNVSYRSSRKNKDKVSDFLSKKFRRRI